MFAVIQTGGKQYKVAPGDKIKVENLGVAENAEVVFDKVLLTEKDGEVKIGTPYLNGAKILGKVVRLGREDKKIVFRYHSKTRTRKKKGHRQEFTEVLING